MKNIFLIAFVALSLNAFAQDKEAAPANPSNPAPDTDLPKGAIVHPTQKQLKSVKKPSNPKAPTSTPETKPSH